MSGERVAATDDGYKILVAAPEVSHPTVLTTVLARGVGHLFLLEADAMGDFEKSERAPGADLAAVMLGLGVLVANGSGIEVKGCGGMKVHQATSLTAGQTALALALALEREAHKTGGASDSLRGVASSLDPVARGLFGAARTFVRAQRSLVRRVDDASDAVARGDFSLKDPNEIGVGRKLLRMVGLDRAEDIDPIDALERELASGQSTPRVTPKLSAEKRRKMAELRALVDETLEGP